MRHVRKRGVIAPVLLAMLLVLGACREQVVQNLSESQANRLVTRLDDSKIEAVKKKQPDGRWSVEVESANVPGALRELQKLHLRRDDGGASHERAPVISSRDQQRFQFERSLSAEIEHTLSNVSGILDARVHLNLPQTDPLFGKSLDSGRIGGSVLLVADDGLIFQREDIAALVSGAAGIPADSISVLIEREAAETDSTTDDEQGPFNDRIAEEKAPNNVSASSSTISLTKLRLSLLLPLLDLKVILRNSALSIAVLVCGIFLILAGVMRLRRLRAAVTTVER